MEGNYLSDLSAETRSSPVSNVLLTNAELDHVMGLLLMRENDNGVVNREKAPSAAR
jgi:phosphoribosyl 1,2-cyclic phosphodiesterase